MRYGDNTVFLKQGRGVADCTYAQRLGLISVIYVPGCRHTCLMTTNVARCCPGYWGRRCHGHYPVSFT